MASSAEILVDAFERVRETSRSAARGLSADLLEAKLDPGANTIAWLLWHLARGQDAQVAAVMDEDQLWTSDGWSKRFALTLPESATGYAHSPDDVDQVRGVSSELLIGYVDAVCDRSVAFVRGLSDADLDRIVDTRFTPPVTLGVRLVSAISDNLQHSGQAAFIRGVLERR
jgi:hypothetical protein